MSGKLALHREAALTEHIRLLNLENDLLAKDKSDAVALMSPSWQLAAKEDDNALTRFVEMANKQFEIRDQLAKDKAELIAKLQCLADYFGQQDSKFGVDMCVEIEMLLEKHKCD